MTTMTPPKQIYWEDVNEGDELPSFSMKLGWTTMARAVSGSQDFYEVHHDPDFAKSSGHSGIFYCTRWTRAILFRLLTDWIGIDGWVKKFEFQLRRMNMNGDTMQVRGKVLGKREVLGGPNEIDLEIWIENEREGITTPGGAVVQLPSRP